MNRQVWLLTLLFALTACPLRAAFILDDFDDPAIAVSPDMFDEYVVTSGVGPLAATRNIGIVGSQGNPIGQLDANTTMPSVFTGDIASLNPIPNGSTIAAIQTNYDFAPTDFSEAGDNNALFFDFLRLTSEIPPSLFLIILRDTNPSLSYAYLEQSDRRSSTSLTITVPFNAFTVRGGAPGLPDYTNIQSVNIELRASRLTGGGPNPLKFHMELDRIRVGRVPEPCALAFWALATSQMGAARILRGGGH